MVDIKRKTLSDTELKVIVEAELEAAMGYLSGELADERSSSMDRYLGEPLGTEMEGRSQVQTRDVMEVIEWIMPTLVKIFTSADRAVEFEPVGPEDEPQAEQETDYLNYLFYKKNNGFLILYSWFKDALLQKNGIVKCFPEENEEVSKETYYGLLDEELQALLSDEELEVFERTPRVERIPMADTGQSVEVNVHDVTFKRTNNDTQIKIENIPPEEFLISRDARSVDPSQARFVCHRTTKTVSDLREAGYTDKQIMLMDVGESEIEFNEERLARNNLSDEERWNEIVLSNTGMQKVRVNECYLRADKDGDGYAELLKVFYSGEFIEAEEIDYHPFSALTPIILTHKFFGLSIADILKDLQEIRTGLFRAYMDNIYQTINGTTYYDENTVNIDDMLTSKPYGIRGVDGPPSESILHIPPTGLPPDAFSLNELLDKFTNDRVGDFRSQLDPNVLAQANTGVVLEMLNEAKAKVEMIARIFAEVGVKHLFRNVHHLARMYSDKETRVKLNNNWVPVDPRQWRERTDLTVRVGLGTNNKQEMVANLNNLVDRQIALVQLGVPVFTPKNIYNALSEITEQLGLLPDRFWTPPEMIPPPPEQQDPQLELIKLQQQVEAAKIQVEREKLGLQSQQKQQELEVKAAELEVKRQSDMNKADQDALKHQTELVKGMSEQQRKAFELSMKQRQIESEEEKEEIKQAFEMIKHLNESSLEQYRAELDYIKTLLSKQEAPEIGSLKASLEEIRGLISKPQPRKIVYDNEGRIIQIGDQKVKRDTDGRATSIE